MKIAVVGKGNVGGGLAELWERAGHQVKRLGRGGGDVSGSDVVLLAVPGSEIARVFDEIDGLEKMTVIDATNVVEEAPPEGFPSNTEYIRSRTGGPTAKAFNLNFASIYDRLSDIRERPGNLWCGDAAARDVVEQLSRDAGYDPISVGGVENAPMLDGALPLLFAINRAGLGPFFYRMASPEEF
jgi:8-hydroxy-5-deazaflavin:NADPH oxidoreductase